MKLKGLFILSLVFLLNYCFTVDVNQNRIQRKKRENNEGCNGLKPTPLNVDGNIPETARILNHNTCPDYILKLAKMTLMKKLILGASISPSPSDIQSMRQLDISKNGEPKDGQICCSRSRFETSSTPTQSLYLLHLHCDNLSSAQQHMVARPELVGVINRPLEHSALGCAGSPCVLA